MAKKYDNSQENNTPTLEEYLNQRAQVVRDSAAFELYHQEEPKTPIVPRTSDNIITKFDALLGTPDSTLINRYGIETDPANCIYNVTNSFGDKWAVFSGNKTFQDECQNHGYKKIPNESSTIGDIIQLEQLWNMPIIGGPYHAIMQTGTADNGEPLYSYSRGDNTPYVVEDGTRIKTMQKDRNLDYIKARGDSHSTYRYIGSPQKRMQWTKEYLDKYDIVPNIDTTEQTDAVKPLNQYTAPIENIRTGESGPYKGNYRFTEEEEKKAKLRKAFESRAAYNKMMEATSLQNTSTPKFKSKFSFADGGILQLQDAWDALSMAEKAEMMKVAVKNGIYDLPTIRQKYNEFAEGGDTDWSYDNWKKQIALHKGIDADKDRTYDYEGFFHKYPQEAWAMLRDNPNAHFSDEFKTVYHPTFSAASQNNDGSIYSGVKHPIFNPEGLKGGIWSPDYKSFTMSVDGYRGPVSMDERKWYLENAEDNGVQLREADGCLPIYDGVPWAGVLPAVTVTGRKHSIGGPLVDTLLNEYAKGGGIHIKPSHRGRLTELKKRTGKSEAELYRTGSAATRKMITFARNARKWKHGEGGNLFDGESQNTQKMQVGLNVTNGWKPYTTEDILANARRLEEQRQARETALSKLANDYLTTSNDATAVTNSRTQNQHLAERAIKGAKAHRAWEEEHPVINAIGNVLGTAPLTVAAIPAVGAAIESTPAVASALAPGSAFWMNPLTQQMIAGTAMSEGINLGTKAVTHTANAVAPNVFAPADSWGELVSNGIEDITGWDPKSSAWTSWLPDATNPGWWMNPSRIINPVGKVGQATEDAVREVTDNYFFLEHPNSFTRGIGDKAGLQDLIESGLVRGNPVGTEVTAKAFGKLYNKNRGNFRDIMQATGRKDIEHRFYNRTLTEEDFNAIKEAAKKYQPSEPQSNMMNRITLMRQDVDPLSKYPTYQDYQAQLASDRQTLSNATSLDDSGQPLAYFYDDGRNPLTAGHDYAASKYGVRINNASSYNPRIFDGHLHYSMPEAVPLSDPNVEVFRRGLFGITRKMDKSKLMASSNPVTEGMTPWTTEIGNQASRYSYGFFGKDVLPRLFASRAEETNPLFTQNSPYLGKIFPDEMSSTTLGETSPMVLERNGKQYTVTVNNRDMSPIDKKLSTVIHEMREDMINFHKGLYSKENQEAYQFMQELDNALSNYNVFKIVKMIPKYKKMKTQLDKARQASFLTSEEESLINSAYRTPKEPKVENSGELNEKVSENTNYRSQISRRYGDVTGDELDKVIKDMPDDELLDILSNGKSYGQDYRAFIEENPEMRTQMIKNIKKALTKVGVFTGVANTVLDANE